MAIDDGSDIESIDDLFGDDDLIASKPPRPSGSTGAADAKTSTAFDDIFADAPSTSLTGSSDYGMDDSQRDDYIDSLFGDGGGELSSLVSDFSKTDTPPMDDIDLDSLFESDDKPEPHKRTRRRGKSHEPGQLRKPIREPEPRDDGDGIDGMEQDGLRGDSDDIAGGIGKDEKPYRIDGDGIDGDSIDGDSGIDGYGDYTETDSDGNGAEDAESDDGFDDIMAKAYDDSDDDIDSDEGNLDDGSDEDGELGLGNLDDLDLDGMIDGFMTPGSHDGRKSNGKRGVAQTDTDSDDDIDDDIDGDDDYEGLEGIAGIGDGSGKADIKRKPAKALDPLGGADGGKTGDAADGETGGRRRRRAADNRYNGGIGIASESDIDMPAGIADIAGSAAAGTESSAGGNGRGMSYGGAMAAGNARPTRNEMDERHRMEREERRSRKGVASGETEDVDVPQWVVSMRAKIRSNVSHAFLLSGNIRDYMVRNISIEDGIVLTLDPQLNDFDIVCTYDQAHGLGFYESDLVIGDSEPEDYRDSFLAAMHDAQDDLGWERTDDVPANPVDLFTIISKICEQQPSDGHGGKILMFADFLELLVPDANGSAMRPDERKLSIIMSDMCRSERADECGSVFVFFSDNLTAVSQVIRSTASRTDVIEVPAPVLAERQDFIDHVIDVDDRRLSDGRSLFDADRDDDASGEGVTKRWFAINTAGLACYQIEDIALRSLSDDMPITKTLVKERKSDIIRTDYENVLEIMDPRSGFDAIGGMDNIKAYFQKNVINPVHRGDFSAVPMGVLLSGAPGVGKSYNNYTPIYRLNHNKVELTSIKDLRVGDKIFGCDGQITTVINKYPQGELDAYRIFFKDGRTGICSADHLWGVYSRSHNGKMKMRVKSTQEMIDKGIFCPNSDGSHPNRSRYFIPMNGPLDFPEKELPVDPYLLGVFIGNGDMADCALSLSCDTDDEETVKRIADIVHAYTYKKKKTGYSWYFYSDYNENNRTNPRIQTYDIFKDLPDLIELQSGQKYIPEQYIRASYSQRLALLQGLMDTDGCIHSTSGRNAKNRYNCDYSTTSEELAWSLSDLLFTLGMSNTVCSSDRTGQTHIVNGKEYIRKSVEFTVRINIPNEDKPKLFRLSRKKAIAEEAAAHPKRRNYDYVGIIGIEKLDKKLPMTCITVDADDGLFCVGKDCVVTHNTMLAKAVAYESGMNCVNLNLNQIMDKWVGSSERNLKRALDCAQAMAPTILFIDEIDEALPNRHNNNDASGVNKRMNQMLLTYFSDTTHRGQVVVLAATNYPDKLDPAIKRMGRFDDHIPMFAPDRFGRARILLIAAKKKGYTLSWFESPDKMINNPFSGLINWLEAGNRPHNQKFVGNQSNYYYTVRIDDGYGQFHNETHSAYLPEAIQKIIGKPKIAVHEFYRGMEILLEGVLTGRTIDTAQGIRESDADYFARIDQTLAANASMFFADPGHPTERESKSFKFACRRMKLYDMKYGPFYDKTEFMTGAELDVVVSKCITLMRDMVSDDRDRLNRLIRNKEMTDEHDIPFEILREACETILPATVGIKQMEDAALLDATDMSFIPDAKYNTSDEGKDKSYRERLSELRAMMQNAEG